MKISDRAARWTLAALVAGSLGFGASQAVAAPTAAKEEARCIQDVCWANCRGQGALSGGCNLSGVCVCRWD